MFHDSSRTGLAVERGDGLWGSGGRVGMLAWLKSKFRGANEEAPPSKPRAAAAPPPREKPRDEALWELLRDERGPFSPLAPADEELVVQLVLKVVDYVCNNPIDPPAMPALAPRILEVMRQPEVDVPKLV